MINQTAAAITSLPAATIGATINGLISVIGLLAVLTYFVFTIPQTGFVKRFRKQDAGL